MSNKKSVRYEYKFMALETEDAPDTTQRFLAGTIAPIQKFEVYYTEDVVVWDQAISEYVVRRRVYEILREKSKN